MKFYSLFPDYEGPERQGASGMFYVMALVDEKGRDVTVKLGIDQTCLYHTVDEVQREVAARLKQKVEIQID